MFPHVIEPFIANAPMYGTANAGLAAAVTKAGGFGFIGGGFDFTPSSSQLVALDKQLLQARELLDLKPLPQEESNQTADTEILPVGIGLLTFHNDDASGLIPLIKRHRPAAIWLFAQASQQHAALISALKPAGASWNMKIFVQIGSLQSALVAVQEGADVIVVQGSDAGGHQFAKNASLVTLLPEISDAVRAVHPEIPIIAAGGIMDGRGIAAALALGAIGVVMGTRFVATTESSASEANKSVLVSTTDGGVSTVKSTLHDALQGRGDLWPLAYDGRAVISGPYQDVLSGSTSVEQATEAQKKAAAEGDRSKMVVWAGAGIGLIKDVPSAEHIVNQSRSDARKIIASLSNRFGL